MEHNMCTVYVYTTLFKLTIHNVCNYIVRNGAEDYLVAWTLEKGKEKKTVIQIPRCSSAFISSSKKMYDDFVKAQNEEEEDVRWNAEHV